MLKNTRNLDVFDKIRIGDTWNTSYNFFYKHYKCLTHQLISKFSFSLKFSLPRGFIIVKSRISRTTHQTELLTIGKEIKKEKEVEKKLERMRVVRAHAART